MSKTDHDCPLCRAIPEEDHGLFFVVTCRTCQVPLIVLGRHDDSITMDETDEFLRLLWSRFPGCKPRGEGMRSVAGHWHEHVVPMANGHR